jgi:di/tricarboxylate transporter
LQINGQITDSTIDPTTSPTKPSLSPTVASSKTPSFKPSGPSRNPTYKPTRDPTYRPKANSIYGKFAPTETLTSVQQQAIVGTLSILLFVLMATEITSPEVLFMIALIIVILTEILTLSQGLAGFSNNAVITIGTLYLVVGAVEKSHVVDWFARKTFGTTGSTLWGKCRMFMTCFFLSIWFNNTPLVAILMPVVKDWGRMRGVGASQLLMPLSYSVLSGSFGSIIGTSTNLTVQGLMKADRGYQFTFFAPLPIGLVCFMVLLMYMILMGPILLPKNRSGLIRKARDSAEKLIAEIIVTEHSPAVGRNIEYFANSLGIAPSSVIKIRRVAGMEPPKDLESGKTRSSRSILDYKYLKETVRFWETGKDTAREEIETTPQDEVEYIDIIGPEPYELVGANDIVFLSSAQEVVEKMMKSIAGESKGLKILKSNVLALPGFGSEVLECVISDTNPFLGKKVSEMAKEFHEIYQAALITVRGRDWIEFSNEDTENLPGIDAGHLPVSTAEDPANNPRMSLAITTNESEIELGSSTAEMPKKFLLSTESDKGAKEATKEQLEVPTISEHIITLGDVVLCVTNEKQVVNFNRNRDFFVVSSVGSLPKSLTLYGLFPVLVFMAMMVCVACELIDICPCAVAVMVFFFMGGWIVPEDIPALVDVRLLVLLGASLSFATSMTTSGLAATIAQTISKTNPSPFLALLLIYAITLIITELISNNAAAALMYPIAVGLADQLGVSFKTFAMCVLVASTAGFMSPIGYQTHLMVWAPGGYRFKDFIIFGIIPDLIFWFIGCSVITLVFPF